MGSDAVCGTAGPHLPTKERSRSARHPPRRNQDCCQRVLTELIRRPASGCFGAAGTTWVAEQLWLKDRSGLASSSWIGRSELSPQWEPDDPPASEARSDPA